MSKADKLLNMIYEGKLIEVQEDIKDYLNRKDKLVVGSEWVCDVDCIGSKKTYSPYDDETVFVVDVRDFVTLTYFIYDNAHEDDMPLEQFLACFSPVEKENEWIS